MTRASDTARLLGAGATILDGTTITTADNTEQLTLISTDEDANQGPVLRLRRDSASPADNDIVGYLVYSSDNDAGQITDFGGIRCHIDDASDGTEDGNLKFFTNKAGTEVSRMGLASSETVFNEDSVDVDFRVESNGNANMFFVNGGDDNISIGHGSPTFATGNGVHLGDDHFLGFGVGNGTRPDFQIGQASGTNTLDIRCGTGADTSDLTINTSGNLLVNCTITNPGQNNSTTGAVIAEGRFFFNNNGTDNIMGRVDNGGLLSIRRGGTEVGLISVSASSTSYATSSDYRLKENVTYDFDATSRLKQLKPARFNFIVDADTTVDGFLAHEVSSIVPEAISGTKDATQDVGTIKDALGAVLKEKVLESEKQDNETWTKTGTENVYQSIDQSKLVPLLVKTIQELEARITTLENA